MNRAVALILGVIFAVAAAVPAQGSYRSDVLSTAGLAGFWDFDNAVTRYSDMSGNGVNGTPTGAPTFATGLLHNQAGQALITDGSHQHVSLGDNYDFSGTQPFTAEMWVRWDAASVPWPRLISKETGAGAYAGWSLQLNHATGALTFNRAGGGVSSGVSVADGLRRNGRLTHVAATYDGATMRLYLNGTQAASAPSTLAMDDTTAPLLIGARPSATASFQGALDDVALYNRALTAAEVSAHRDAGAELTAPTSTTLTSTPPSPTDSAATFAFTGADAGTGVSGYDCRLDAGVWYACSSPHTLTGVADGRHTLQVRAVDMYGNADPAPATSNWTADANPPRTELHEAPGLTANLARHPSFETASSSIRALNATYSADSSWAAAGSRSGRFVGRGVPTSNMGFFTQPMPTIPGHRYSASARVKINVPQGDGVRIGVEWRNAAGTQVGSGFGSYLASGEGTVTVTDKVAPPTATQMAFYVYMSGANVSTGDFNVDSFMISPSAQPPRYFDGDSHAAAWTGTPHDSISRRSSTTDQRTATFKFVSEDATAVTYRCQLDSQSWETCTSPYTVSGLTDGTHTLRVEGTDQRGQVEPVPLSYTWQVESSYRGMILNDLPDSYWPLDETSGTVAADQTGLQNGTYVSAGVGRSGLQRIAPSRAVELNGGSGYVSLGDRTFAGNQPFTAEAWVNPDRRNETTIRTIISAYDGSGWALYLRAAASSGASELEFVRVSNGTRNLIRPISLHPGRWYHVMGTYDGTTMRLYVNGAQVGPATNATAPLNANAPTSVQIGRTAVNGWKYGGLVGHAALYSRALTAADAAERYAAGEETVAPTITTTAQPAATITSTSATVSFTISEPATVTCKLDAGSAVPCTDTHTFTGLADGPHQIEITAVDTFGNVSSWHHAFTVDTTAPNVTLTTGPPPTTATADGETVTFTVDDSSASTACQLDSGPWTTCSSPYSTGPLTDGEHTVRIRATDTVGNVGTATQRSWTQHSTAPDTAILTGPTGYLTGNDTELTFSGSGDVSRFECRLDSGPWATCVSPLHLTALTDGSHTVQVRAVNAADAADLTPAQRAFNVDTGAPSVTITARPAAITGDRVTRFVFGVDDLTAQLSCRLDDGAWEPCASPHAVGPLDDGAHQLQVRAVDPAGHASSTVQYNWQQLSRAPQTRMQDGPAAFWASSTATFTFDADTHAARYECRLDSAPWAECVSPYTIKDLPDGPHSFEVRAVNAAHVADPDSAGRAFVIDTQAPKLRFDQQHAVHVAAGVVHLKFLSDETGVRYECQLNGSVWEDCPPDYEKQLSPGDYTLAVRAIDRAGNATDVQEVRFSVASQPDRTVRKPEQAPPTVPAPKIVASGDDELTCSVSLSGPATVERTVWLRDGKPIAEGRARTYKLTTADSGHKLTCAITLRYPEGSRQHSTSAPILTMGATRLSDLAAPATVSASAKKLAVTFRLNRRSRVLVRLWCRNSSGRCGDPRRPVDWQLPARRSYMAANVAGLTKYRRVIADASKGSNTVDLARTFKLSQLPAGDYKITVRIAQRRGRGYRTSRFLSAGVRVTRR